MNGTTGGGMMWFVADVAVKAAVILALAGVATVALRRGPAAARHWTWVLAVVGVLVLPLAGLVTPELEVAVPGWTAGPESGAPDDARPTEGLMPPQAPVPSRASTRRPESGSVEGGVRTSPRSARVVSMSMGGAGDAAGAARSRREPTDAVASGGDPEAANGGMPWTILLTGLWGLGAVALLVRLVAGHRALRTVEARAGVLSDPGVRALASTLAGELGIRRHVRLLEGGPDAMPMSWGMVRPAILLPAGADAWPRSRLAAVLLHELAHVRRWDCLSQALAEVAVAIHWMNPLAWYAAHRLRVEREHACDDAVLQRGARATAYATELVRLAREFRPARAGASAALAMSGPSHLRARVAALLDAGRPRTLGRGGALAAAGMAGAAVMVLASVTPARAGAPDPSSHEAGHLPPVRMAASISGFEPAGSGWTEPGEDAPGSVDLAGAGTLLQETTCGMAQDGWESTSVQSRDDERITMEWSRPGCTVQVRIDGDVEFTDDFRDIARLSSRGSVRIEEEDGRTERWLEITPGAGGRPEYEYRVDRDARPFDAGARAWYEGMLLQTFRRSGIAAEERVAALLRTGGQAAVMQEIDQLRSDHVFARYVEELILQADLTEQEAVRLVETASERVESDHYTAQILLALADRHLTSDQGVDAFLRATRTLESDHYRAQVLSHALERRELERDQVLELVRAVNGMESDHYTAEVLGSVAQRYFLDEEMRQPYLQAVMTVESDHYKAQLLQSLLERGDLSAQETAVVLEAVGQMESDHYKAEILKAFGRDLEADQIPAYLDLARSVESDHYRSEILLEMASRDLTEAQRVETIRAVEIMESDHYKAAVLEEIIRSTPERDGPVYDALVEAMGSIESRHYRGQIAELLLPR